MALRDFTLTFAGGDQQIIKAKGNFFRILETTTPITISVDGGVFVEREQGQAQFGDFETLIIKSAAAQSIVLTAGIGQLVDNRTAVSVAVTTDLDPGTVINNPAEVSVAAGATSLILAANANRHRAVVQSAFANDPAIIARVGGATVNATSGLELTAGAGLPPWATTAAIYCHNPGAAAIVLMCVEDE